LQTCADLYKQVDHPAMLLIYDGANIVTQGYNASECFEQYQLMKKGLGWMHIKDYRNPPGTKKTTHVDEEALKHFVPCDIGDSGHEMVLRDFKEMLPKLEAKPSNDRHTRGAPREHRQRALACRARYRPETRELHRGSAAGRSGPDARAAETSHRRTAPTA